MGFPVPLTGQTATGWLFWLIGVAAGDMSTGAAEKRARKCRQLGRDEDQWQSMEADWWFQPGLIQDGSGPVQVWTMHTRAQIRRGDAEPQRSAQVAGRRLPVARLQPQHRQAQTWDPATPTHLR